LAKTPENKGKFGDSRKRAEAPVFLGFRGTSCELHRILVQNRCRPFPGRSAYCGPTFARYPGHTASKVRVARAPSCTLTSVSIRLATVSGSPSLAQVGQSRASSVQTLTSARLGSVAGLSKTAGLSQDISGRAAVIHRNPARSLGGILDRIGSFPIGNDGFLLAAPEGLALFGRRVLPRPAHQCHQHQGNDGKDDPCRHKFGAHRAIRCAWSR
jgi:hypothetical protein